MGYLQLSALVVCCHEVGTPAGERCDSRAVPACGHVRLERLQMLIDGVIGNLRGHIQPEGRGKRAHGIVSC
jgi:hypothetical protein